jgi:tRNA-dihydrouridine synthase A
MMDWTDRHCRFFHRQLTRQALLYTEMVTAPAVIRGDRPRLLGFDAAEQPVALQLGGADAGELAEAARIGADFGYAEINLNVGCPSDRVQSGRFGACLMREPDTVARGIAAMRAAVSVPVTVKCRIGVDDQNPQEVLPGFITRMREAGAEAVIIHARKAWLEGLSPKENRTVPPLDYDLVYAMKRAFPDLEVILNGGVATLEASAAHLQHTDGVMIGRAAYENPYMLANVDRRFFGAAHAPARRDVAAAMKPYIARNLAAGGRLHDVTRHMLGLYHGQPGARAWRRVLSTEAVREGAGLEVLDAALAEVAPRTDADAA